MPKESPVFRDGTYNQYGRNTEQPDPNRPQLDPFLGWITPQQEKGNVPTQPAKPEAPELSYGEQ